MKSIRIVSDFNSNQLIRLWKNINNNIKFSNNDFNQVYQEFANYKNRNDITVFWTNAQRVIPSFNDLLEYKDFDENVCYDEVRNYAISLKTYHKEKSNISIVPSWHLPLDFKGIESQNWKFNYGPKFIISKMNMIMSEIFSQDENIYLIDSEIWFNDKIDLDINKLWYTVKVPYSNNIFLNSITTFNSILDGVLGKSKKIIILDLDNTLWGGIIGDDGIDGIKLGGHDYLGEAFLDFQKELKKLKRRGILLAICSKNNEKIAIDTIKNHSEMILKKDDFVTWRINWDDKATNIQSLMNEINLGLDSAVFLDDNPLERDLVKKALNEIEVPDLPLDPTNYSSFLRSLNYFESSTLTKEDFARSKMYKENIKRIESKKPNFSFDRWIKSTESKLKCIKINNSNIERAIQLFNKTNQMNLSTRRLNREEFLEWIKEKNRFVFLYSLKDRFGDLGIIGLVSLEINLKDAMIVDFILSCRAMGRNIENMILSHIRKFLIEKEKDSITAVYKKTSRNSPILDMLKKSDFEEITKYTFKRNNISIYFKSDPNIKFEEINDKN